MVAEDSNARAGVIVTTSEIDGIVLHRKIVSYYQEKEWC